MGQNLLFDIGFTLTILGAITIFVAALFFMLRRGRSARGGGIIMIGPIPIVFGSDAQTVKVLIVFAAVLMAVFFVMNLLLAQMG
jgi:uncharacterized protein (TIGR00304 family)